MSYAMHVGRVGALAVALGIGLAVANTPGVAWAAPDTGADPSEVSGQAPDQKDDDKGDPPDGGPLNGSVDPHDSGDSDDADDKVESGDSGTLPGAMQVDSSGGAVYLTKPGTKGAQSGNEDVADRDKDRALPERKRLRAGKPDSRAQAALVPKKPKHLVLTASAPPSPSAEGLDAKERASALRVAPSNGRADQVVQSTRPVAEIAPQVLKTAVSPTVTPSVVVAPEPEPTNLMSRVLSLVTLVPAAGDGQPAGGESPLFLSCLAACRRVSQQASMEDEKSLRVADPTETSLMLAEADSGAQLMMAMAAVTVDPPTVGAPDQVTGAVSGSLNGYTVTGAPASGTVTVIGDTYTYTPTVPARLRAALTTQPDYDSFPVALSGQPAATVTVPVLPALAATESSVPLGTGSNPSAVAVYGNLTYVANATARTVKVINTDTNQVIATVPVQTSPSAIAVSPDGKAVWVANAGSRTVQRIDTQSKTVVATVTVGTTPTALAVTADSVWVANAGSRTVQRIDTIPNRTTTNKVVATTTVGSTPSAIAVSGDRVYVANKSGNSISVISASTNKVISTKSSVTAPSALAVTDGKLYVTQQTLNRVLVLNSASMAQITTISVQSAPTSVAISRDGSLAYVASSNDRVSVIDTKANTVLSTVVTDTGTPTGGHAIAIDGTGTNTDIYLTDAASNSLRVLSVVRGNTAPFGGAATVNDPDTTIGVVTGSVIATDADGDALTYSVTGQPSAGGTVTLNEVTGSFSYQPSDPARDLAATTPNQDFTTFTVTATDRQAVTTIPVTVEIAPTQSTPQLAPTTTQISLGAWPDFLATKGSRVYVLNAGESTVSVIDTNTNTVIDTSDQLSAGGAMVLSPDGKLYVAEYIGNRVLVLDSATLEQVDTINVTTTYGGTLAVSQDGERLYVGSTKYDSSPTTTSTAIPTSTNTGILTTFTRIRRVPYRWSTLRPRS